MEKELSLPSCKVSESSSKLRAVIQYADPKSIISFTTSANGAHCLALPAQPDEAERERIYHEIKPEQCVPLSHQSYHIGTGSCILHPPLRHKPAADGQINYSLGTDCNDSGTGWGNHSTATQLEAPAFDYAFRSEEAGTLQYGAVWDVDSLSIRCSGGSPIDPPNPYPCHGRLKGAILFFVGAFKIVDNGWSYIRGADYEFLAANFSYTKFFDKTVTKSDFVASTGKAIENVAQGDIFCIRAGMKFVHNLDLDGIDGDVRIHAKCRMQLMSYT